jgi:hypothetical protein
MPRLVWVALLVAGAALPASAQVVYPKPPDEYAATVRYRIRATGEQRIVPFDALAKHLKAIGFKFADENRFNLDRLDPGAELVTGTVPSAAAGKLLDDPSVRTVLLSPAGEKAFDDPAKVIQLRIDLAAGLPKEEQQRLHGQAVEQLEKVGFVPSTGYDHKGYTRVRGALAAGSVPLLVKDLRSLPGGWFVGGAGDRAAQPLPLRNVLPVRTVEVVADLPASAPPAAPADGGKLTAALAAVVADPAAADKPLVVEAVMERDTSAEPAAVRRALRAALTGVAVEGLAGTVVTLRLPKAAFVKAVADLPDVRHVRLPRVATETVIASAAKGGDVLSESRLKQLHALGYDGSGVTVAVLASEFPGAASKQEKGSAAPTVTVGGVTLPPGSRLIDLTAELRPTLDSAPTDPTRGPGGTAAALAVHTTAPKAAILLVRVDPARFHQVLTVAKTVAGEGTFSPALSTRSDELNVRTTQLESQRRIVTNEVERAFADLSGEPVPRAQDDPNPDDPKPDDPPQVKRRLLAAKALKQLQADTAATNLLLERFLAIEGALDVVKRATVVVNTLVWETGHPHDGESELSQLIERKFAPGGRTSGLRASRLPPTPAWVQAGGTSVGAVWSGAFRDADRNRLMEFADAKTSVPAGRWSKELAFLGYEPTGGKPAALPAGLKVRVTMQWREPHRQDIVQAAEPTHDFTLRLFRQLDPEGKALASDELAEVAASQGTPVRLAKTPGSGVYEVTLLTTLPADGVYALRVEGGPVATGLPETTKLDAELYPRIVLESPDPAHAAKGRVVFADMAVPRSGVGIPGDSLAAVTAGVGTAAGATSATGVGPAVPLGVKPDLLTDGTIAWTGGGATGTGVAAGYLGGASACLMQAGVRPSDLVKTIGLKPGGMFVLPEAWLKSLSPAK